MTTAQTQLRWIWIALLAGCGAAPPEEEEPRHPCDPFTETRPVEVPPEAPPVCGDGRSTRSRTTCTQTCSRGCGTEGCGPVECRYAEERCDGEDLGAWRCTDNGYAGGTLRCSADCELDWSACLACVEGPGLRCATEPLDGGREVILLALRDRVAAISRNEESGDLVGGLVSADLELARFAPPLARGTRAAAAWGDRLAFVSRDSELRVIDVETRRARTLARDVPDGDAVVLPETHGSGLAVVARWSDYQGVRVVLLEQDGSAMAPSRAAHFGRGGFHLVVAPVLEAAPEASAPNGLQPGDRIVAWGLGGDGLLYVQRGSELHFLGSRTSYTWGGSSITIGWRDSRFGDAYQLEGEERVEHVDPPEPRPEAPGLGGVATAGASTLEAFGGALVANAMHRPGSLGLYLVLSSE